MAQDTYISVSPANLDAGTIARITNLLADAHARGSQGVFLLLSSHGGLVPAAIALYNTMRAMPYKITTHNSGFIQSAAVVAFLAGEHRRASPHSHFMFHPFTWKATNDASADELQYRSDSLADDIGKQVAILAQRTELSASDAEELLSRPQRKSAEWAQEHGLIHEIGEVHVPATACYVSYAF